MAKFCNDNNLTDCISNKKDCCCKVFYNNKIPFCDFPNNCAHLLINKEKEMLDELVNKICEERKSEAIYWNFVKKDKI